MATQKAKFVNKQFNSPINLYSPQAIQETLDRQTQVLANGAVGIDFSQLAKPANLQNSAVLRMLEEEEARQRGGQPEGRCPTLIGHNVKPHSLAGHQKGSKIGSQLVSAIMKDTGDSANQRARWDSIGMWTYRVQAGLLVARKYALCAINDARPHMDVVIFGRLLRYARGARDRYMIRELRLKRVAWPPPPEDQDFDYIEQAPVQAKPTKLSVFPSGKTRGYGEFGSYQSSPSSGPSPQPSSTVARSSTQSAVPSSPSPISSGGTLLRQPSHFQQQQNLRGWTPVTPPATSPLSQQHPLLPDQQQQQQQQQTQPWQVGDACINVADARSSAILEEEPMRNAQHSQDPYDRAPQRQQQNLSGYYTPTPAAFEAPPSTIVLRPEPPISQTPAPVYQAQPAATKAPATGNMRGDLKWPPASVKAQFEAENRARVELAKGPAFRPRRVHKDYSGFFAQHALNSSYPGYRAPPGTQYFTPAYQQ
ncbi:PDZ and LIM domain protein Zasp [Trachymyrmex septentrionalis]|uniref:PDZ and LIM domain protein Zasp n=1 Tax=Trachymyrmex septentrionalis TaxID=34720 RepID=A0A195FIQ0_9HYME|nr:PDZ and LIM domain protein Zasp [Trachymyrmex septentrionalis]